MLKWFTSINIITNSMAHSTSTLAECNTFCWFNIGKKMLAQYISALWSFVMCFAKCSNIHVFLLTVEPALNQHCVYKSPFKYLKIISKLCS